MRAKRHEAVRQLVDFVNNEYTLLDQALRQAANDNNTIAEALGDTSNGVMFKHSAQGWTNLAIALETIYNDLPEEMEW